VAAATVVVALYLPGAVRQLSGSPWADLLQPLLYVAGLVVAERFVVKVPLRATTASRWACATW